MDTLVPLILYCKENIILSLNAHKGVNGISATLQEEGSWRRGRYLIFKPFRPELMNLIVALIVVHLQSALIPLSTLESISEKEIIQLPGGH